MKAYHIIIASIIFSLLPAFSHGQCFLRIRGQVVDGDTKEKINNASIEVKELRRIFTSDSLGTFNIEGLCPGHYEIVITHIGCQPVLLHVHLKDDYNEVITLPHRYNELENVTVQTTGSGKDIVVSNELKGRELDALRGLSLGESLQKLPGVNVIQTGSNIYKPVIHGLHSSRILILNNGIRQEGQQWGSEHAPEIDPYIANRLTVIKGAGTIRYGGDAIGGVILVEPKLLPIAQGISGEINTAFFSNNKEAVISGILEGNSKKYPAFSWRTQGSLKKGGNAKTPGYWLDNSGFEEYNFSAAAGWRKKTWGTEVFFSQFNTKLGIFSGSHIGNTKDLIEAINNVDPPDYIKNAKFSYEIDRPYQKVQHNLLKLNAFVNTGNAGKFSLVVARQFNSRQEFDKKRFASSDDVPQLDLEITTYSADAVWDHYTWHGFRGTVGISGMYQDNWYQYRLFIPQYQLLNTAAFIIEKYDVGKITVEAGLRYDYRNIYNIYSNDGTLYNEKTYNNLSGNIGAAYKISTASRITINASSAWRAPNVNELYSDGLHHGAARLEKGNAALIPERANSIIGGFAYNKHKWQIEAEIFYKQISGFIYLKPTYPPQLTIRGAFPSFAFAQTDADLYGGDLSMGYRFNAHFKAKAKTSLLWAWDKTAGDWLIQMPPNNHQTELEYYFSEGKRWKQTYIKAVVLYTEQQQRVPATGNIEITKPDGSKQLESDYAPPPPAYTLFNIETGTSLQTKRKQVSIILSINNLLNTRYRNYMNAFRYYSDEVGTNISLRIKVPFSITK